jgi:hypothetical protein
MGRSASTGVLPVAGDLSSLILLGTLEFPAGIYLFLCRDRIWHCVRGQEIIFESFNILRDNNW